MPRYFFDVSHHSHDPDAEGSELPDIQAARAAAVNLCGAMIQEFDARFWQTPLWQLQVTDHDRRLLFTLTFSAEEQPSPI